MIGKFFRFKSGSLARRAKIVKVLSEGPRHYEEGWVYITDGIEYGLTTLAELEAVDGPGEAFRRADAKVREHYASFDMRVPIKITGEAVIMTYSSSEDCEKLALA